MIHDTINDQYYWHNNYLIDYDIEKECFDSGFNETCIRYTCDTGKIKCSSDIGKIIPSSQIYFGPCKIGKCDATGKVSPVNEKNGEFNITQFNMYKTNNPGITWDSFFRNVCNQFTETDRIGNQHYNCYKLYCEEGDVACTPSDGKKDYGSLKTEEGVTYWEYDTIIDPDAVTLCEKEGYDPECFNFYCDSGEISCSTKI